VTPREPQGLSLSSPFNCEANMDEDKVFFIFKMVNQTTNTYFYIKREVYPSELAEKSVNLSAVWHKRSVGFAFTEEEADEFIAQRLDVEFANSPYCLQLPLKGTALLYTKGGA